MTQKHRSSTRTFTSEETVDHVGERQRATYLEVGTDGGSRPPSPQSIHSASAAPDLGGCWPFSPLEVANARPSRRARSQPRGPAAVRSSLTRSVAPLTNRPPGCGRPTTSVRADTPATRADAPGEGLSDQLTHDLPPSLGSRWLATRPGPPPRGRRPRPFTTISDHQTDDPMRERTCEVRSGGGVQPRNAPAARRSPRRVVARREDRGGRPPDHPGPEPRSPQPREGSPGPDERLRLRRVEDSVMAEGGELSQGVGGQAGSGAVRPAPFASSVGSQWMPAGQHLGAIIDQ